MNTKMDDKLRVGVSGCLLGEAVRYDGGHKGDVGVGDRIGPEVEWVSVCPEVELGLGVPREPLNLVGDHNRPRLMARETGRDWTEAMVAFAGKKIDVLKGMELDAFIFKSASPSCGINDVKVYASGNLEQWTAQGRGVFARYLLLEWPDLPVADESELSTGEDAARFLEAARQYREKRRMK